MLLNEHSNDWWLETSWRSCGVTVITTPLRYYNWLRLQWFCISFWIPLSLRALTEAVRELCSYKLRNALIAGPAEWGMRDQNTCFFLKCSHCCVYFSVLELLQPVTPGNPLSRPHWSASGAFGLPQPGDQMTLVCPSFPSTQICNFLDSFKWSMAHFYISLLDWSDM